MITSLAFVYLMSQPAGATTGGQGNALITFLPLILVFVVFYFFMIRPQMKKQKEMTNYRNSLKKGDKVVTTGGIYGRVHEVKDNYIMMDAGGDIKLKVDKSALVKDPTADE
ncbi:MAG TPA: preprotein translocase subunit YajC [Bacteroidales bacterium]|nr:preprotein translocase subunit YajC [Bacteroidales bacterium]HOX75874.1 preprotein translocase subunit YajC [Bacteroidales bacterium]HPM87735.1 preprotein translocase subunit YajC [Bacteroidales bacterium]HQM70607.1 preprotein translocase subunit YajC [Bacteroidales bacterium]